LIDYFEPPRREDAKDAKGIRILKEHGEGMTALKLDHLNLFTEFEPVLACSPSWLLGV